MEEEIVFDISGRSQSYAGVNTKARTSDIALDDESEDASMNSIRNRKSSSSMSSKLQGRKDILQSQRRKHKVGNGLVGLDDDEDYDEESISVDVPKNGEKRKLSDQKGDSFDGGEQLNTERSNI